MSVFSLSLSVVFNLIAFEHLEVKTGWIER